MNQVIIISLFLAYTTKMLENIAYSSACFVLVFKDVKNALIMIFLALHGLQNEFKELLIDILNDLIEVNIVGVRKCKHNLDDTRELLLEDFFNELAGSTLWDRLRGFAFVLQLLVLGGQILNVGILFSLPGHVVLQEMLNELSQPEKCLTF